MTPRETYVYLGVWARAQPSNRGGIRFVEGDESFLCLLGGGRCIPSVLWDVICGAKSECDKVFTIACLFFCRQNPVTISCYFFVSFFVAVNLLWPTMKQYLFVLLSHSLQTYTSEFESHLVPHSYGLVPYLSKKLSKLLLPSHSPTHIHIFPC